MLRSEKLTKKCARFTRGCRAAPTHLVINTDNLQSRRLCDACTDVAIMTPRAHLRVVERRTAFVQVLHYLSQRQTDLWIVRLVTDVGAVSVADRGLIRGETDRVVAVAHAEAVARALDVPVRHDDNLRSCPGGLPPEPEFLT